MKLITTLLPLLLVTSLSVTTFTHADKDVSSIFNSDFSYLVQTYSLANNGDANAQYDLAVMYDTGRGVAEDDKEALMWYLKAAEQG
ncbi:MAG TPA: hypothetical protein EYO25_02685, partial [Candidatus Thioglobus sp.]|nr:hypothetical protein [Candidatus Thioglobus sp.]